MVRLEPLTKTKVLECSYRANMAKRFFDPMFFFKVKYYFIYPQYGPSLSLSSPLL